MRFYLGIWDKNNRNAKCLNLQAERWVLVLDKKGQKYEPTCHKCGVGVPMHVGAAVATLIATLLEGEPPEECATICARCREAGPGPLLRPRGTICDGRTHEEAQETERAAAPDGPAAEAAHSGPSGRRPVEAARGALRAVSKLSAGTGQGCKEG